MKEIDGRDGRVMDVEEFGCVVRCYRKTTRRRNRRNSNRSKMVFKIMSPAEFEAEKLTRDRVKR